MRPTVAQQTGMKQQQFEALFAKYRRLVYGAAYSVTGNTRDAEDARECAKPKRVISATHTQTAIQKRVINSRKR